MEATNQPTDEINNFVNDPKVRSPTVSYHRKLVANAYR